MNIQVTIKSVYGNECIYPACGIAKWLCELAETKTFTDRAIRICKALGYQFEVVNSRLGAM